MTRRKKHDAYDPKRGLLVCKKRCDQCLYARTKIVNEARKLDVLATCKRRGSYFICHKASIKGKAVVCRGFYDEDPNLICQLAKRMDHAAFVDPETGQP